MKEPHRTKPSVNTATSGDNDRVAKTRQMNTPHLFPKTEQRIYMRHAYYLVLLDVDRCKSDRDNPGYKYRSVSTRSNALQEICERYKLQHYGNKSYPYDFEGASLYKSLQHNWTTRDKLRKTPSTDFDIFWQTGTDSCNPDVVLMYKKAHDAFALKERSLQYEQVNTEGEAVMGNTNSQPYQADESIDSAVDRASGDQGDQAQKPSSYRSGDDSNQAAPVKRKGREFDEPKSSTHKKKPAERPELALTRYGVQAEMSSVHPRELVWADIKHELDEISDLLRDSALWLAKHLRLNKCQAVASPEPNDFLLPVYKRCWGDDWRSGADALLVAGHRSVEDDTLALIAAFLLDRVFLRTGMWLAAKRDGHTASAMAVSAAAADSDNLSPDQLGVRLNEAEAALLKTQLFAALEPYFDGLSELARLVYASPLEGYPHPLSHVSLQNSLFRAVDKALSFKTSLESSRYMASFTWPERGDQFNPVEMQTPYGVPDDEPGIRYRVAFTKFPGVRVVDSRRKPFESEVAYKAVVVLRVEAAVRD